MLKVSRADCQAELKVTGNRGVLSRLKTDGKSAVGQVAGTGLAVISAACPGSGASSQEPLGIIKNYFEHSAVGMDGKITLSRSLQSEEIIVWANVDVVKQILLNLGKDVSEALSGKGSIVIVTRNSILEDDRQYAQLSVSDNGQEISTEVLSAC